MVLKRGRALPITTLLIVVVAAMVVIPMLLSRFGMRAGFVDIGESITLPGGMKPDAYYNSAFLPCRSDGSGKPCPEGSFCSGASRGCVQIAQPGI